MSVATEDLQDGFAQFVLAARELEASYAALKLRAEAVDLELQESNRALQRSLAEREAVFAALPIGLVALRADGSVASRNREAERLTDAGAAAGVDLVAHRTGEAVFDDFVVRVRRVALPDGELVLLEDRSRLEELESEVRRLDRLAGLSELALGVAHEIKNPLNGVLGFANMLERCDAPDTMKRYAARIAEGVRAVDDIVRSMLGFARPAGKPVHTASVAEVVAQVAAAVGLPRDRWQLRGAADARVDADALTRVVTNLVRNSLEANGRARVSVDARVDRDAVELLVEDDGPGVSRDVAERVFEPFVSSKQRGSGLGLALSARVLEFLGGRLELLNPGQTGARFRIRVPLVGAVPCGASEAGA